MAETFDENEFLEQAFVVEAMNDDFDLDIPPTSGMEYLRRVQLEAKQCPLVVVADIDTTRYKKKQTVQVSQTSGLHPAPRGFAPSGAWQKQQTTNFSIIRQKLARHKAKTKKQNRIQAESLPDREDMEAWCRLCFGQVQPDKSSSTATESRSPSGSQNTGSSSSATENQTSGTSKTNSEKMAPPIPTAADEESPMVVDSPEESSSSASASAATPPLLRIVAAMDQVTVIQVLEYQLHWFEASGFSPEQGRWFYALLTVLEKPLAPETCSLLRSFARNCANLRASLEREEDPALVPMNLFITLVSRYFDQIDMADPS